MDSGLALLYEVGKMYFGILGSWTLAGGISIICTIGALFIMQLIIKNLFNFVSYGLGSYSKHSSHREFNVSKKGGQ